MKINRTDTVSFNAKLGNNLKNYLLKNDFAGDKKRLAKYEQIFCDTFEKNLDTNTVVEIAGNKRFKLYNLIAPKVTYPVKVYSRSENPLSKRILTECNKVYSYAEYRLFERIVSKLVNSGKSIDEITELGNKISEERKPYFDDMIKTADRILKENPQSKLTELEMAKMRDIQLRELIESDEFQQAMSKGDLVGAVKVLSSSYK